MTRVVAVLPVVMGAVVFRLVGRLFARQLVAVVEGEVRRRARVGWRRTWVIARLIEATLCSFFVFYSAARPL